MSKVKQFLKKTFCALNQDDFNQENEFSLISSFIKVLLSDNDITNDINQFDDVKQCISEYFSQIKTDKTSINQTFISNALNSPLFNDFYCISYLLSFCEQPDVLDSIEIENSINSIRRFSLLNISLDIESYFFKSIEDEHNNKNSISNLSIQNKTLLLWYILNVNASLLEQIYKNDKYIFRDVNVDSIVQRLETSEFGEMMIRQFPLHVGIRNLESLLIFDIYRVRAIEMPSNLFHHILEYIKSNDVDIRRLLSGKLYINHSGSSLSKMLLYFYQRVKEPAIFRVLVKSLILMESLDREFIQSVLTPFKLEFLQFSNSYVREFLLYSKFAIDFVICDPFASFGFKLFDRIHNHDPTLINKIFKKINHQIVFNIIVYQRSFSYINRFFPDNQKSPVQQCYLDCNTTKPTPTLNYMVLKHIISMLLFDKYLDTKSKVQLSMVSKIFFNCCSSLFTNIPNVTIRISSRLEYIGSQFCLFKKPPPHLDDTELKYIPYAFKTECLDNLESYRHFGFGCSIPETSIFMNLKFLKFKRSVHGTNTHFQRMLDATNKDQLVSVEFISNVSTMLVSEEMSSLLELRKSSPNVNISASVSTTSIAIDNPDQHSLITSCFFNSEPPKNIILSNLRKIEVSEYFTLTRCNNFDLCKRWYDNRDQYFTFQPVFVNRQIHQEIGNDDQIRDYFTSKCYLNSYKHLYRKSIDFSKKSLYQLEVYNDVNKSLDDVDITEVVGSLIFKRVANKIVDQSFTTRLMKSNVESIEFIGCRDIEFQIDRMPESIKLLRLCGQDLKILPESLESLMISASDHLKIDLTSYKSLTFLGVEDPRMKTTQPIKLPPNLRSLECHSREVQFDFGASSDDVVATTSLPESLYKIKIRPNMIRQFKHSNVTKIVLFINANDVEISRSNQQPLFSCDDFPEELERLSLYVNDISITKEMLPRHIKQLKIFGENTIELDAFTLMDRVERIYMLDIHNEKTLPTLPATLKKFVIPSNFDSGVIGQDVKLPLGLEYLDLGTSYDQPLIAGSIPDTVNHFRFSQVYNQKLLVGSLPSSLETLNFFMYSRKISEGTIPRSVRSVCTTKSFYRKNSIQSLPDSVTSIEIALDLDNYDIRRIDSTHYLVIGTDSEGLCQYGILDHTSLDKLVRCSKEEDVQARVLRELSLNR
ncbi:hypothetical protein PPL_08138 [Heterostelium album PN500]|uniref:Uncharacterized protein n=1 Tax=Heterostelium pallidum (strain ATCC 26659 / Pp 5 / PN500) TaxID=670386 RepID=D3BIQ4_HETP5|nr:hypothetical protein PPL_08138 [Heterostelium album PN500]EFA78678.1 hypothetical protein PPL_08138 [Heterostelium album PN500]|eukprot:XP_020430802.1 hypothetical protein PPL_08138 [Heterostelium album PN500]